MDHNNTGIYAPFCVPCNKVLSCAKTTVIRHAISDSHIMEMSESYTARANEGRFMATYANHSIEKRVINFQLRVIAFVAEKNLA